NAEADPVTQERGTGHAVHPERHSAVDVAGDDAGPVKVDRTLQVLRLQLNPKRVVADVPPLRNDPGKDRPPVVIADGCLPAPESRPFAEPNVIHPPGLV